MGMAFTLASRSELELQSKCGHHHVNTRILSFFFFLIQSMNAAAIIIIIIIIIIISLLYSSSSPPMLSLFSLQLQQSPQLSSIIHIPPDKTNNQYKNLIILSAFTFLFPSTIRNKQDLNVYAAIGKKSPQHSIFMSMLVQRNLHNTTSSCPCSCKEISTTQHFIAEMHALVRC